MEPSSDETPYSTVILSTQGRLYSGLKAYQWKRNTRGKLFVSLERITGIQDRKPLKRFLTFETLASAAEFLFQDHIWKQLPYDSVRFIRYDFFESGCYASRRQIATTSKQHVLERTP